mgnify:CR=1 FL=1
MFYFIPLIGNAQWDSTCVVVRTTNATCFPLLDSVLSYTGTGNSSLNGVLSSSHVTHYFRTNPYSQIDSFKQTIAIFHQGSSVNLVNQLQATNLFYSIKSVKVTVANSPSLSSCPPGSVSSEPWVDFRAMSGNPPTIANDWHLQETEVYCAWDITKGDPGVMVALVDAGFHPGHYDLENINLNTSVASPLPSHGVHGTGTSSIIGASQNNKGIVGASPDLNTSLYLVNDLGFNRINGFEVSRAISEAVNDGMRVINLSVSGGSSSRKEFEEWIDKGVIFTAAAGNQPDAKNWSQISDLEGFILVSSTEQGSLKYANHAANTFIEICAPGARIWQSSIDLPWGSLQEAYGTSSAAPQVAAAAGLMLSVDPSPWCISAKISK